MNPSRPSSIFRASTPQAGEPAWELALMYPRQGDWSVESYLALDAGMIIEYTDGFIRVLPMPNLLHQWIVRFVFEALHQFVSERSLGQVYFAPLSIRLSDTKYRQPDVVFLKPGRSSSMSEAPNGADLVVEVVSEGPHNRDRDLIEKRADYAEAGVPEYWIVDPERREFTVLTLEGETYREHDVFRPGQTATSPMLAGFSMDVASLFSPCDEKASESP